MCIDRYRQRRIYLIDFGLSSIYRDGNSAHVELDFDLESYVGTAVYSSVRALQGATQARRDDLESLAYTLIHLRCGSLPWYRRPLDQFPKLKLDMIEGPSHVSCGDLPPEFHSFLQYAYGLGFDEDPDYEAWRRTFEDVERRLGLENAPLDWE